MNQIECNELAASLKKNRLMNYAPLITVFISGLFGLLVAILTWMMANRREKRKFKQDFAIQDLRAKEELYVSVLASLDKAIRKTESAEEFENHLEEFSLISAKVNLLSTEIINEKLTTASNNLFRWSSEYKRSHPKKISNTDLGYITNLDSDHRKKANKIYPDLMHSMIDLVNEIKKELQKIREETEK